MDPLPARLLIVLASAGAMELVAGLVHRFWMHGPGWGWHRSHHEPGTGGLERNDRYALLFALVAVALFALGHGRWWPLYWVGAGLTLYGLLYALVHDGLVHRRRPWPWRWTPRRGYLARLVQAHRLHHALRTRDGGVSFGFLYAAPPARLAARLRAQRRRQRAPVRPLPPALQRVAGLTLAALIVGAWATLLALALFVVRLDGGNPLPALPLVAALTWLDVGLFIVAHDAMHGSLAPGRPRLNRALARLCLALYAGFALAPLARRHAQHHRHPGTADDPDFHPAPRRFWPWYLAFMRRALGWREVVAPVSIFLLLTLGLHAPLANVLLFWALPALLSSLQLFAFGTWLPHRLADDGFADAHRARSSRWAPWATLLACFHFGYHLEHHLRPDAPWWRLPAMRRARAAGRLGRTVTLEDAPTAAPPAAAAAAAPSG